MTHSTVRRWIELKDADGYQHCHGDNCDEYYYRPLVFGEALFTYVAHIPVGGNVPPDQAEADIFEMSFFSLAGQIEVTLGNDKFVVGPHTAVHCPRGTPAGFANAGDTTASLVLSFTPPPRSTKDFEEMREFARKRGRKVWSPEEMNMMAGDTL